MKLKIRKSTFIVMFTMFMVLANIACGGNKAKSILQKMEEKYEGSEIYDAKHRPYQILWPNAWKLKEHRKSGGLELKKVIGPKYFNPIITLLPKRSKMTFNKQTGEMVAAPIDVDYEMRQHIIKLGSQEKGFAIKEKGEGSVNGIASKTLTYQFIAPKYDQAAIKAKVHVFTINEEVYYLSLLTLADEFDNYTPLYNDIVASISFKTPSK